MLHIVISYNIDNHVLPDMDALTPYACNLGLWPYISGKLLVPMLRLLASYMCMSPAADNCER